MGKFVSDEHLNFISPSKNTELPEGNVEHHDEKDNSSDNLEVALRFGRDVLHRQDDSNAFVGVDREPNCVSVGSRVEEVHLV